MNIWKSWNKCNIVKCNNIHYPNNIDEIIDIVKKSEKIRVVGSGRSSNNICTCTDTIINITNYNKIINIDIANKEITFESGVLFETLMEYAKKFNLTLPSLPDVKMATMGGILSTGSHGTFQNGKNLSNYIVECELVKSDGSIVYIKETDELMKYVRISLGLLGILTKIKMKFIDDNLFLVKEEYVNDDIWINNYKNLINSNLYLRVLWLPHTNSGYIIKGNKYNNEILKKNSIYKKIYEKCILKYRRNFSTFMYQISCYFPSLIPYINRLIKYLFFEIKCEKIGKLYDKTVANKRIFTLDLSEWVFPLSKFNDWIKNFKEEITKNKLYIHIPMDIRVIYPDNTILSNSNGNEYFISVGLINRNPENKDYSKIFNIIQKINLKYDGRPHWGKNFNLTKKNLQNIYPNFNDFLNIRQKLDPLNKFITNKYLSDMFT